MVVFLSRLELKDQRENSSPINIFFNQCENGQWINCEDIGYPFSKIRFLPTIYSILKGQGEKESPNWINILRLYHERDVFWLLRKMQYFSAWQRYPFSNLKDLLNTNYFFTRTGQNICSLSVHNGNRPR